MQTITKEYAYLFHMVECARQELSRLEQMLIEAAQTAEEIYLNRTRARRQCLTGRNARPHRLGEGPGVLPRLSIFDFRIPRKSILHAPSGRRTAAIFVRRPPFLHSCASTIHTVVHTYTHYPQGSPHFVPHCPTATIPCVKSFFRAFSLDCFRKI